MVGASIAPPRREALILRNAEAPRSRDAHLVTRIARGDHAALETAFREHGATVSALARRVLRDPSLADDVVQQVFLRLWQRPERFEAGRGSLRSFLCADCHGRSVDLMRSDAARHHREQADPWPSTPPAGPDELAVADDDAARLRSAVASLPDEQRNVIEFAYFGGHTYREVAVLLGLPEGTVKSRIRSGLARLRDELDRVVPLPVPA